MAFDAVRNRSILFGGTYGGGETWSWDGSNWAQVQVTGPSARSAHAMAYDSQLARIVLFGGTGGTGILADTWSWNGSAWSQVGSIVSGGPVARSSHALAYDSLRGKMVMYGGDTPTGKLNDTWELSGSAWAPVNVFGINPGRSMGHAMAFDSSRNVCVLYGGFNGNSILNQTWEWNGTVWSQRAIGGPSQRFAHGLVYDIQRGRTILIGGNYGQGSPATDQWEWDGSTWQQQVPSTYPTAPFVPAITYDTIRNRVVMYTWGQTWELVATPWTSDQYGSGCGSPAMQLATNSLPARGASAVATIYNIPSGQFPFVCYGLSRNSFGSYFLPLTLSGFGMPGCELLQSADFGGFNAATPNGPASATFSMTIPNLSWLLGLPLFLQAWSPAPNFNAAGVVASNGLAWMIQ